MLANSARGVYARAIVVGPSVADAESARLDFSMECAGPSLWRPQGPQSHNTAVGLNVGTTDS